MTSIIPGANAPLPTSPAELIVTFPQAIEIDISAFALYAGGKARGDDDMCFFNQPKVVNGAVELTLSEAGRSSFSIDLKRLPPDVEKVAITATIDDRSFDGIGEMEVTCNDALTLPVPTEGHSEKALILAELYRRGDAWKLRNVSQGFNGGLAALATHFGIEVDEDEPAQAAVTGVDLTKRLEKIEREAPELVSLVKSVGVNLEKRGTEIPRAKVCLCLDISGSMASLFRSGKIDTLVERALALGLTFDDDGEIDVFLFGKKVHFFGTVNASKYRGFSQRALQSHPLEGGTRYGNAMEAIRAHYAPHFGDGLPVFVFFTTDGGTDDKPKTVRMLKESAAEPIFWKLMGMVPQNAFSARRSSFLQELDDLEGRIVDNADFFNVTDPAGPAPNEFFDEVVDEFPQWLDAARSAGILK